MAEPRYSYEKPSPTDFDRFLPWACNQLCEEATVVVTKTILADYVSVVASERLRQGKGKPKPPKPPATGESGSDDHHSEGDSLTRAIKNDLIIHIESIYDGSNNLTHIKFHNNAPIPRSVMKIIGLIIKFHPMLTMITIDSGLQMQAMYEIAKFLPLSKITEICMDYTFLREANYHLLLDHKGLKHLSISKCRITDSVLKNICNKLVFPNVACKTLHALNVSSNRITDAGMKYIADMLRSNRNLSYLNLADNKITDTGAKYVLDCLGEFPLRPSELLEKRTRHLIYLKERKEMMDKTVQELRLNEYEKKMGRRKSAKPTVSLKKKDKEAEGSKSLSYVESIYFEKAESIVDSILGHFMDPFSPDDTFHRDGEIYCYGNNTLSYLNIAYNNLSYFSVKQLYQVIVTQKYLARKPRGLVNVVIEGNYLPAQCEEFRLIDEILESSLPNYNRKMSSIASSKKRMSVK
ncbi:uncharacterized protein LOC113498331 [Trichoplusia ni]|uniref:Uncharacterized protein LOC113498331 n=1 Tax=Trichoplusia ni TaxID=7111 RepID=A0A7E5W0Q6_TRINI|nr:uncharacterized protein LOC113498331 [Trichoplusia ni]